MELNENLERGDRESTRNLKWFRKKAVLILLVIFIVGNITSLVVGIRSGDKTALEYQSEGIVKLLLGASTSNAKANGFTETE